jgi:hypothetical protein
LSDRRFNASSELILSDTKLILINLSFGRHFSIALRINEFCLLVSDAITSPTNKENNFNFMLRKI